MFPSSSLASFTDLVRTNFASFRANNCIFLHIGLSHFQLISTATKHETISRNFFTHKFAIYSPLFRKIRVIYGMLLSLFPTLAIRSHILFLTGLKYIIIISKIESKNLLAPLVPHLVCSKFDLRVNSRKM